MIICKELNKSFSTKREMYDALVKNKAEIMSLKKSAFKTSDNESACLKFGEAQKQEGDMLKIGDVIKVAINTIGILDSHNDLHVKGIWDKSAKEQDGKTYHAVDHELSFGKIVGYPNNVKVEVIPILWSMLGKPYEGYTEVLAFTTTITEKTNNDVFMAYRDGDPVQHSARMQYVMLYLCINEPELKDEFANWTKYYDQVANKEVADSRGYFWAITEAKIAKEGSTVLFGSNDATPALPGNNSNKAGDNPGTEDQPLPSTEDQPQFDFKAELSKLSFFNTSKN